MVLQANDIRRLFTQAILSLKNNDDIKLIKDKNIPIQDKIKLIRAMIKKGALNVKN